MQIKIIIHLQKPLWLTLPSEDALRHMAEQLVEAVSAVVRLAGGELVAHISAEDDWLAPEEVTHEHEPVAA